MSHPLKTLEQDVANDWRELRNSFVWGGNHIVAAPKSPDDLELELELGYFPGLDLGLNRCGAFVRQSRTDLRLDQYHNQLLTSSKPHIAFLGCASVIYNGHWKWRAQQQVGTFAALVGNDFKRVRDFLTMARRDINAGRWGDALGHCAEFGGLRQPATASRIIAALDTENAGCHLHFRHQRLANAFYGAATWKVMGVHFGVKSTRTQHAYQLQCQRLRQLRDVLNSHGVVWQGAEATPQRWRALDVQRALSRLGDRTVPAKLLTRMCRWLKSVSNE
jgi:hypothetical protein